MQGAMVILLNVGPSVSEQLGLVALDLILLVHHNHPLLHQLVLDPISHLEERLNPFLVKISFI
jgi:hypothetical protein